MKRPTCTVEGCDRPNKARGYCQTHYMQYQRGVPITPIIKVRVRDRDPICTVDGCDKPEQSNGLCGMHLQRTYRHGSTDFRSRQTNGPRRPCGFPDCDRPMYYGGYCQKHIMRSRKAQGHGLTTERYIEMLQSQNFVCAICEEPETTKSSDSGEARELAIDHCHETGIVRGLLCGFCNRGIGLLKDNPARIRKAADYIERFKVGDLV